MFTRVFPSSQQSQIIQLNLYMTGCIENILSNLKVQAQSNSGFAIVHYKEILEFYYSYIVFYFSNRKVYYEPGIIYNYYVSFWFGTLIIIYTKEGADWGWTKVVV